MKAIQIEAFGNPAEVTGCLPAEKFPTSASHRQGRGRVTLLSFHPQFPEPGRVMLLEEESPAYGDGSARASLIRLACDNRASAQPLPRSGIFPVFPEFGKGQRALVHFR